MTEDETRRLNEICNALIKLADEVHDGTPAGSGRSARVRGAANALFRWAVETRRAARAGRDEERRRTIAWLRERGMTAGAASIEAGDHWGDE
jgi:hypothetical protein